MTDNVTKRPPALAGACIYLGALAAIISIRAITVVTTWNGDGRAKEFDTVLQALRDAGISRATADSSFRVFLTVIAVLAACAAVFAGYTARGHRSSRIGLTVTIGVAGAAAFLGFLGGGFLFSMIGALAVVFTARLWTGEIRTYFRTLAGHAPPPPKPVAASPAPVPAAPTAQQQPGVTQPIPHQPPPAGYGTALGYGLARKNPSRPPRSVAIVVWTTLVGSALVASVSALGLLVLGVVGDDYEQIIRDSPFSERMLDRSGMSPDQIFRTSITLFGMLLALSIGGLAASTIALVKKRSGAVFLFVMAIATAISSLVFFPIGLPWTAAAIVCAIQLHTRESKAWFSRT